MTDVDRAMTLTVGHVRAELANYFDEESTDSTEGYVARILARVRELEDENARLRTRQEHATADWCRPHGLDKVIDDFVATHNPWPTYPERLYIDPIEGETRHAILLMAHSITRVCLEQADLQMRIDADRDTETIRHDE